jgi:hypothetical protein
MGLPAFVLFFVTSWLVGFTSLSPLVMMQRAAATRDPILFVLLTVFMIGGAVVGLGIRRREPASH